MKTTGSTGSKINATYFDWKKVMVMSPPGVYVHVNIENQGSTFIYFQMVIGKYMEVLT